MSRPSLSIPAINSLLHEIPSIDNAEMAFDFFQKRYQAILNKHAPIQILTRKQLELELKPWITKGISESNPSFIVFSKKLKNLNTIINLSFIVIL